MPKTIQIRHVPDDLHRKLKAQAAMEGMSLSGYLLQEVRRIAQRLAQRSAVIPREPPAQAVRAEREGR